MFTQTLMFWYEAIEVKAGINVFVITIEISNINDYFTSFDFPTVSAFKEHLKGTIK